MMGFVRAICAGCGKSFAIKPYELSRSVHLNGAVCCSMACRTGPLNNAWKGGPEASRQRLLEKRRQQRQEQRYKLDKQFFAAIRRVMLRNLKTSKVLSVLPYSAQAVRDRLLSTMPSGFSLRDYAAGIVEIDHIRPLSSFGYASAGDPEFLEAWGLSNIRLLTRTDNRRKGISAYAPTTRLERRHALRAKTESAEALQATD